MSIKLERNVKVCTSIAGSSRGCGDLTVYRGEDTPPVPVYCTIAAFTPNLESNVTSVISNNDLTTTNLVAAQGVGIYTDPSILFRIGAQKLAFEFTAVAPTGGTDNAFGGLFGQTDLFNPASLIGGMAVNPNTGSGDGTIDFLNGFTGPGTPVLTGLSITYPYKAKVVVDGSTGDVSFRDNQVPANSATLGNVAGIGTVFGSIISVILPAQTIGAEQNVTYNLGSSDFEIDFENDALPWCQLDAIIAPEVYELFEFLAQGNATYADRVAGWTTSPGVSSNWTGSMGYPFSNTETWSGQIFENETTTYETDSTFSGKTVGGIVGKLFLTDTSSLSLVTKNAAGFGNDDTSLFLSSDQSNPADSDYTNSDFELVRDSLLEADIILAVALMGNDSCRLCYQTPSDTVFFDQMAMLSTDASTSPLLQMVQSGIFGGSPATYETTYNGTNDDLVIDTYPDSFTSSFGQGIPFKSEPEVKSTRWLNDYFQESAGDAVVLSNGGKTATMNFVTTASSILLNCARLVPANTGIKAMTIELGDVSNPDFVFKMEAINRADSNITISRTGGDLIMEVTILGVTGAPQVIQASYSPTTGDQIAIEMDTDTGTVTGLLYDGAVKSSSTVAFDAAPLSVYMPRVGNEGSLLTSWSVLNQFDQNDLPVGGIRAGFSVGAIDILGEII